MLSVAERLDRTFGALADPTRRAILARLTVGEATVTELAEPFAMSLPAVSKHLKVLERAGLIARGRGGRGAVDGLGGAVRDEPPRRLQAPQGAGAGRPDRAGTRGPVAALPAGGRPAQGGGRLGGGLPPVLGAEPGALRPPRRLPAPGAGEGGARRPDDPVTASGATTRDPGGERIGGG